MEIQKENFFGILISTRLLKGRATQTHYVIAIARERIFVRNSYPSPCALCFPFGIFYEIDIARECIFVYFVRNSYQSPCGRAWVVIVEFKLDQIPSFRHSLVWPSVIGTGSFLLQIVLDDLKVKKRQSQFTCHGQFVVTICSFFCLLLL
jgi:hypothetical protein